MNLTHAELSTVLAALRYWQERIAGQDRQPADGMLDEIATDGGTVQPLNAEQIDALCERLNNGEYDGPNYAVLAGNFFDGLTFYGPFEGAEAATEFGEKRVETEWLAVRLERPNE